MPMADEKMTVEVFRYDPDAASGDAAGGGDGGDRDTRFDSYEVPYQSEWVVLDALNWIKDEVDGSVTYRWSCRMGVCGSCGRMVNRVPKPGRVRCADRSLGRVCEAGPRRGPYAIRHSLFLTRHSLHAPIVALAVSLHGPFSPVVAIHLSM